MTSQRQFTDPARELTELLQHLATRSNDKRGYIYLAEIFSVEPFEQDFFKIISVIMDRLDHLRLLVSKLELDEDIKVETFGHLDDVCRAFSFESFANSWVQYGYARVATVNVQPLRTLSGQIRQIETYPKLSDDEIQELKQEVLEFLSWLEAFQSSEPEFIRQGIIDGLNSLLFRLNFFGWVGYGYTVDGLKDVMLAYVMLERHVAGQPTQVDSGEVLNRLKNVMMKAVQAFEPVKVALDNFDVIVRIYGLISLSTDVVKPALKLITQQ